MNTESLMLSLIDEGELRRMRDSMVRLVAQVEAELSRRGAAMSPAAPASRAAVPSHQPGRTDVTGLIRASLPKSSAGTRITKPEVRAALLSYSERMKQAHGPGHPDVVAVAKMFGGKSDALSDWIARNRDGKNPLLNVVTKAAGATPGVYEFTRDL